MRMVDGYGYLLLEGCTRRIRKTSVGRKRECIIRMIRKNTTLTKGLVKTEKISRVNNIPEIVVINIKGII